VDGVDTGVLFGRAVGNASGIRSGGFRMGTTPLVSMLCTEHTEKKRVGGL
jgi:hypothetical protein